MTTYFIYTLTNPTNGELFYVGCTSNKTAREEQHIRMAGTSVLSTETGKYLKNLKEKPIMTVVDNIVCTDPPINNHLPKPALYLERDWIIKQLNLGHKLTNTHVAKWHKITENLSDISDTSYDDSLVNEPIVKPKTEKRRRWKAAAKEVKVKREKKIEVKDVKRGKLTIPEMNTLESMRESFPSYKMFSEFVGFDASMISRMIEIGHGTKENIDKIKEIIHGTPQNA